MMQDDLVRPPEGARFRRASSYGSMDREISKPRQEFLRKYLNLAPGEVHEILRAEGAGKIVRFWFTAPVFYQRRVLRDLMLRVYWDQEDQPSILCPIGDFFGAAFGRPVRYVSHVLSIAGGGYLSNIPMPFSEGARLELINQGRRKYGLLFYQLDYYELDRQDDGHRLHVQWRRDRKAGRGKPHRVCEAKGRGRFLGCRVDMQNRSWWLKFPLREIQMPHGLGLGILEGWDTIATDGSRVQGTGGEDYFNGGWYFKGGRFSTPTNGCLGVSYLRGRCSAYRFHVHDPIPFDRSLELDIDVGLTNQLRGDYVSTAYWYQTEPHAPMKDLPPPKERRPQSSFTAMIQMALFAAIVLLVIWGIARLF